VEGELELRVGGGRDLQLLREGEPESRTCRGRRRVPPHRPEPLSFASYIAASACRISSSGSSPSRGQRARPMLAPSRCERSCVPIGSRRAVSSLPATSSASWVLSSPSSSTRNSSPDRLATVSSSRTAERSRSATVHSTRSPASCPSRSLTRLKPSRSRKAIVKPVPVRRPRAIARSRRSSKSGSEGRPVSASWRACHARSPWSRTSCSRWRTEIRARAPPAATRAAGRCRGAAPS
jgi:hypothetical protein